jgi:hypothetical protein
MMKQSKYELNIISRHPKFDGKTLVKHFIDNIDTIGVWGEEAFEIQVKNNTSEKVQVRISLDGTDVLTAQPANVQPGGKMWLLGPWQTLNLPAWPEDTEKGARFMFGKTANSVAANTHGDLSQKGIVAAAFFSEGYIPRQRVSYFLGGSDWNRPIRTRMDRVDTKSAKSLSSYDSFDYCAAASAEIAEINEGPAVGAGETIQQKIASVQGLRQPTFDQIVSLRYLWWDDLKAKLEKYNSSEHPSGFIDAPLPQKLANLGKTPRIERAYSA